MNQPKNLLSIGAFAQMTQLSIKALRLYDQLGLLQPCHVEPQSGYRYYSVDQLSSARMIRNMRDMDMPLATIRQVLAAIVSSPEQAEALATEYAETREEEAKLIRERVKKFIQQLQQEKKPMSLEVDVKTIPSQQVLSLTRRVKVDKLESTIQQSLKELNALAKEQNVNAADTPFGIYHGTINEQDDGPIEICLAVNGKVKTQGNVIAKQLEGGKAACVTIHGKQCSFPEILNAYDAVADWIQNNGYEITESPREVWYAPPGENEKVEIVWLFK